MKIKLIKFIFIFAGLAIWILGNFGLISYKSCVLISKIYLVALVCEIIWEKDYVKIKYL